MKPYYQDEWATIYHGSMVKCDAWTGQRDQGVTGRESGASQFRLSSEARSQDTSKVLNTSRRERDGGKIITPGKASASRKRADDLGHSGDTRKSAHAPSADQADDPNDIISTETPRTTNRPTSSLSVENATWRMTDASKTSKNSPKETSQKQWPPAGVDWYYYDEYTAIANGDCREILPSIGPVDLVLTDPPYGVGRSEGFEGFGGFGTPIARKHYGDTWDSMRPDNYALNSLAHRP